MRAYFSRRYRFSASHRLHSDTLSEEENRATYGKCNNPMGHGHNYVLQVTVGGEVDPHSGMVCDLVTLDQAVTRNVIDRFAHANLNLDESFLEIVPTTENLCVAIHQRLSPVFTSGMLGSVDLTGLRVEETANNSFDYFGEGKR